MFVATKLGSLDWPNGFTRTKVCKFTEDSLRRIGVEALDLTQLHCIPTDVLKNDAMLGWLAVLKREGKIHAY